MKSFKPEMEPAAAADCLRRIRGGAVSEVLPIGQGEISRVYGFEADGRALIAHFNGSGDRFHKARYVRDRFAGSGIPIPRTLDIGEIDGLCYAIAERAPGRALIEEPEPAVRRLLPELAERFAAIVRAEPQGTRGYGWILPSGDGSHDSWPAFLASFFAEEQSGFWEGWHALFADGFLERDVFDRLYALMMADAGRAPARRHLVHGDFHLGNVVADGRAVTAIVDWEMAMYGDFVFDLATMQLWSPQLGFAEIVRDRLRREGMDIPDFDERLRCALLFKGLDSLRFFAKKGDRAAYDSVKADLLARIGDGRAG